MLAIRCGDRSIHRSFTSISTTNEGERSGHLRGDTTGFNESMKLAGGFHQLREQNEMEPPAGDAPAGIPYKRNPQAAAWRRAKLNFGSLLNASPSKDKATGLQNNDGCDVVFPS